MTTGYNDEGDIGCTVCAIRKLTEVLVPATSYLAMNTTDDSFPILVRKDSYAGGLTPGMTGDYPMEGRKVGLPPAPSTFGGSSLSRPTQISPQAHRGMLEDLETAQNRPLPDFALPSGQKSFPGS